MFTGLVRGLGEVLAKAPMERESRFTIKPIYAPCEWEDGESISVNGVCLSVERHEGSVFQVYASKETLMVTTLAALEPGSRVNLEPALAFGERLGGHLVSGHIDCVAIVKKIAYSGESREITLGFPREFAREVVKKGSVALDGISLTINQCGEDYFTVNIIPDSLAKTNISTWKTGSRVNMETDLIGKYVVRALEMQCDRKGSLLDREFLAANGFL